MSRKSPKCPPSALPASDERAFEKILRANDEIADEGEPLKENQTHRYEGGKPVRKRFSMS